MHLLHEDLSLGLSEVSMIVATELVVAIDKVAEFVHSPVDLAHRADLVSITIHHCYRRVTDSVKRDISSPTMLLAHLVSFRELLEAGLDAVLEKVS